jgi:NTP pyrophosphatase (non-canonical NTP hydrolase)
MSAATIDWYFLKMQEETWELLQAWLRLTKKGDARPNPAAA